MATTPNAVSNLFIRSGQKPGEQSFSFNYDFSSATAAPALIDPTIVQMQNTFGLPRTIYIDNTKGSVAISGACSITGMTFNMPPYSTGFIPISCIPQSKILLTSHSSATNQTYVEVYNWEIPPVLWDGYGPYVPGALTGIDGEDEANMMSPTNPVSSAPKDCETVAYARVDLTTAGGSTALIAAGAIPLGITIQNAGDLTGATAGGPAYVKTGAAAVASYGKIIMPGQTLVFHYRTTLALNGIVDATGVGTSILVETYH
jgi:hypothetical protein